MGKQKRVIDVDVYEEDNEDISESRKTYEGRQRRNHHSNGSHNDRPSRRNPRNHNEDYEENESKRDGYSDSQNVDFGQLAGLLQNVDLNQIASLLGGLGGSNNGGNGLLNNLGALAGSGSGQGLLSGLSALAGSGGLQGLLSNIGSISGILGNSSPNGGGERGTGDIPCRGDRGVEILWALRPMVAPERAALIEMVLQLYAIGKILKGTFY